MQLPIHSAFADLSVLDYLAVLWPDRSQRGIAQLFERGGLRCRGRRVGAGERVGDLEELVLSASLDAVPSVLSGAPRAGGPDGLRILYEDARLAALAKPSGVPVVPDRGRTLESCLEFLVRRELEERRTKPPAEHRRYRIVHRIDRLTSGLVLVAKTAEAERRFSADFEARRIHKEYLAIVLGVVEPARAVVDCPIVPGRKGRMRAEIPSPGWRGHEARDAVTEFEVIERFERFTLVRAVPRTGRTHQIRVHAWALGHPLAVDPLYGAPGRAPSPDRPPAIERLSLHAHRYLLPPDWEEPRDFVCPPPADFAAALEALRSPRARVEP
jgi:RluA family pseudouridine synthase